MEKNESGLVLNKWAEHYAVKSGLEGVSGQYTRATLESALFYSSVKMVLGQGMHVKARKPQFKVTKENSGSVKEALETTLSAKGIKGAISSMRGRKRSARRILKCLEISTLG